MSKITDQHTYTPRYLNKKVTSAFCVTEMDKKGRKNQQLSFSLLKKQLQNLTLIETLHKESPQGRNNMQYKNKNSTQHFSFGEKVLPSICTMLVYPANRPLRPVQYELASFLLDMHETKFASKRKQSLHFLANSMQAHLNNVCICKQSYFNT